MPEGVGDEDRKTEHHPADDQHQVPQLSSVGPRWLGDHQHDHGEDARNSGTADRRHGRVQPAHSDLRQRQAEAEHQHTDSRQDQTHPAMVPTTPRPRGLISAAHPAHPALPSWESGAIAVLLLPKSNPSGPVGRAVSTRPTEIAPDSSYRGVRTQNSLPSGSTMTTQSTSPSPMSIRAAPSVTRRSTSA